MHIALRMHLIIVFLSVSIASHVFICMESCVYLYGKGNVIECVKQVN